VHAKDLAKKWQADATLVDILGPDVDANGISSATSSYSWSYTFLSKKTDKVFMISVGSAADVAALSKVMTDNSYLFLGSDAGLKGTDMQLSRCDGRPAVWKIRAFEIDAVTGKQVKSGG
jgi:hypothetical protein